jgi:hypothetical protein
MPSASDLVVLLPNASLFFPLEPPKCPGGKPHSSSEFISSAMEVISFQVASYAPGSLAATASRISYCLRSRDGLARVEKSPVCRYQCYFARECNVHCGLVNELL